MRRLFIAVIIIIGLACQKDNGHECPYPLCAFKGQFIIDHSACGCEEGSDCWILDAIHFEHPYDTYDQNEEMLFGKSINHK